MFNRRSIAHIGLAFLCSLSTAGLSAKAGSISYEGLEGARCNVSTDTPSSMNFRSGWNESQGANVQFGLTVPLSSPTEGARDNCVKFAELDQQRQHFTWLLDMYDSGVITREALATEAEKLGMKLAPSNAERVESSSVVIVR